jgi:hypothetical protein
MSDSAAFILPSTPEGENGERRGSCDAVGGELPIAPQRRLNERVAAVVIPTQVRIVAARQ